MSYMFWIWLGVVVVATVIELVTLSMTSIWFAAGGLSALILSIFPAIEWYIQVPVFVVVSFVLLICLRKIFKKFFTKNDNAKTNSDAIVGKRVRALSDADAEHPGEVKVGDVVWTLIPADGETPIAKGEQVEIVEINGNKLVATKIQK